MTKLVSKCSALKPYFSPQIATVFIGAPSLQQPSPVQGRTGTAVANHREPESTGASTKEGAGVGRRRRKRGSDGEEAAWQTINERESMAGGGPTDKVRPDRGVGLV